MREVASFLQPNDMQRTQDFIPAARKVRKEARASLDPEIRRRGTERGLHIKRGSSLGNTT